MTRSRVRKIEISRSLLGLVSAPTTTLRLGLVGPLPGLLVSPRSPLLVELGLRCAPPVDEGVSEPVEEGERRADGLRRVSSFLAGGVRKDEVDDRSPLISSSMSPARSLARLPASPFARSFAKTSAFHRSRSVGTFHAGFLLLLRTPWSEVPLSGVCRPAAIAAVDGAELGAYMRSLAAAIARPCSSHPPYSRTGFWPFWARFGERGVPRPSGGSLTDRVIGMIGSAPANSGTARVEVAGKYGGGRVGRERASTEESLPLVSSSLLLLSSRPFLVCVFFVCPCGGGMRGVSTINPAASAVGAAVGRGPLGDAVIGAKEGAM